MMLLCFQIIEMNLVNQRGNIELCIQLPWWRQIFFLSSNHNSMNSSTFNLMLLWHIYLPVRIYFNKKMNLNNIFAKSSVCCEYINKVNKFLLHSIISMTLTTLETWICLIPLIFCLVLRGGVVRLHRLPENSLFCYSHAHRAATVSHKMESNLISQQACFI